MAISQGLLQCTGRFGNLVYYYVGSQIYCRTIFPDIRKRVMKDERYALFRVYSGLFGQSSKIGSVIYRELGVEDVKLYRMIVSDATRLFKHTGMKGEEVMEMLWKKWVLGVELADSPEVTRQGVTKPVVKKSVGRTVREHILKLQGKKVHGIQSPGSMMVGKEGLIETGEKKQLPTRKLSRKMRKRMRIMTRERCVVQSIAVQ